MAASPRAESAAAPAQDKFNSADEQARDVSMAPAGDEPANGGPPPADDRAPAQGADGADYPPAAQPAEGPEGTPSSQTGDYRGEKQVKVLIWSCICAFVFGPCTLRCLLSMTPIRLSASLFFWVSYVRRGVLP